MPYHLTLDNYTPTARLASTGTWTDVRFEYAAARPGPWTLISTEALSPLDTDGALPATRDFTVIVPDVGYPGWLRVVFVDALLDSEPTEPIYVGSAIRPTVLEVANLMPDRTTITGGTTVGTFTSATHPTATQVDGIIDLALDTVDPKVVADADAETQRSARSLVVLTAAILTEVTYFSHQGDVSEARIAAWQRLIEQHQLTLATAAATAAEADDPAANTLQVGTVRWTATDPSVYEIVSLDITS